MATRYSVLARQQNFERYPSLVTTTLISEGTAKAKFQRRYKYIAPWELEMVYFWPKTTLAFWSKWKTFLSISAKYFYAGIEGEKIDSEYVWFLTRLSDVWSWPRRDNSMIRLLATCRCTVVVFVFSLYCVCICICTVQYLYMYLHCTVWYQTSCKLPCMV